MGGREIDNIFFDKDDLLHRILSAPFSVIKVFHIENSIVVFEKIFKSNWEVFNYFEKIKPSQKNDGLIISSANPLPLNDIKMFMDGKLLRFYGFVFHNGDKIPQDIEFHYRHEGTIRFLSRPYFLFRIDSYDLPENKYKEGDKAAAVFLSTQESSEIAENIKLLEDAGYCLMDWKVVSDVSKLNFTDSLSNWLLTKENVKTAAVFFQVNSSQLSKLETLTGINILTRDDLVIEIFESRADGSSGKLKLANAMIEREKTVFRKKIKGLSRIKGGIGLKGPGETKEEERKRILKNKEASVRKALKSEGARMDLQKRYRMKRNIPTIAIVGYTNAGKSTLFNALLNEKCATESNTFFSSIDPKIKKLHLFGKEIFLIDTVGFIENMSKDIIDAYKATFSDITDTSLIIHVVDSTAPAWQKKEKYIDTLLIENGADKEKMIKLFSKKDLVRIKHPVYKGFFYSALNKEDIRLIKNTIYSLVFPENNDCS